MDLDSTAKRIAILDMIDGWPSAADRMTKENVDAYCSAVDKCSLEAVQRATARLRDGMVPDQDRRFVPPAAELAHQARLFDEVLGSIDRPAKVLHHGITRVDFGWPRSFDLTGTTVEEMEFVMQHKRLPEPGELAAIANGEKPDALPSDVRAALAPKVGSM